MLVILTALFIVSVFILAQAPQPVAAVIFNEPDDPIDTNPPDFEPPQGGFTWRVPTHYGGDLNLDGMVDTYWRAGTKDYDPAYLYPDTWPMNFYGCQTLDDFEGGGTNTYQWVIDGTVQPASNCYFTHNFATQGTYAVTMTVTSSDGASVSFPQEVFIKDYFIVAIGDSLASGEGNPDIPQPMEDWRVTGDETWQDLRCHRSADAYPSMAALALENSDPHTSVTFINFACSGASINTPTWDPKYLEWMPPFVSLEPDVNKYRGTGILGTYIGMETDNYDQDTFIPSQIDQLQAALTPPPGKNERQFDALIISAGGNDLHFGEIGLRCMLDEMCWPDAMIWENPTLAYNVSTFLDLQLKSHADGGLYYSLPDNFATLAARISGPNGLSVTPDKVYITQYMDQTRADNYGEEVDNFCTVVDDIFWPVNPLSWMVIPAEAERLTHTALHDLNHTIQAAADAYGWQYIDGITSYEVDPDPTKEVGSPGLFVKDENGKGHGYCASDNWIIRAAESELIQGPWPNGRRGTAGTLHPNAKGIEAIKTRLLYYMLPDLEAESPDAPAGDPPVFTSSFTSNGLTSQPGENGLYTHSCDSNQSCAYSRVVLQVTATGSAPLEAANVYVNNLEGCSLPGVSCPTTVITPTNQLVWNFTFLNDGIYQMQFAISDVNDQISDYVSEIKVDLHDPVFNPLPGPYSVDEGSSTSLTAVANDIMSAILNVDWDLDNDGIFETHTEQPNVSTEGMDGPTSRTIGVRVTDEAGRMATRITSVDVLNVAPMVMIMNAPSVSDEGTEINLTSEVSDPGEAETFTYAWNVKKDGSSYATGSEAGFSFTPADEGFYEVSLSVLDDDSGEGTANIQTIEVTNVAPVLSNVTVPTSGANEAASLSLSGDITEPGTEDSLALTVDWGDGSLPEEVSLPAGTTEFSLDHTYADDNPTGTASDTYDIEVSIEDDDGGKGTGSSSVVVYNLAPTLSITDPASGALYAVNTTVSLSGSITDAGSSDTFTCSIVWDDGSAASNGSISAGVCTASHQFTAPGVYTVQMTVADDDTGSDTEPVMLVVYDPSAGFVTGGGWINSPAGAYRENPTLTGKATFGFVSKYTKGQTVPTGNTAFNFDVAGLSFASQSYEWLVVNQNGSNAQFKGSGTINGLLDPNGNAYKFMLWASDSSPDTFHIHIWWEDAAGQHDVYDNGIDQTIGAGNIVVHTGK